MQTFRKLPTMHPRIKNTTDQKWNGTAAQTPGSRVCENITYVHSPQPTARARVRSGAVVDVGLWTLDFGLLLPIHVFFEFPAHDRNRRGLAAPDFQRLGALIEQHTEAVGGPAPGGFGRFEQG